MVDALEKVCTVLPAPLEAEVAIYIHSNAMHSRGHREIYRVDCLYLLSFESRNNAIGYSMHQDIFERGLRAKKTMGNNAENSGNTDPGLGGVSLIRAQWL